MFVALSSLPAATGTAFFESTALGVPRAPARNPIKSRNWKMSGSDDDRTTAEGV